ncbi:MAG: T9SS type A sorting domain-containing protein, partial [Romboutsia sp.]|nr:T9SS type A sorting domain-containing protein [Romboutsia sp.]
LSWNYNYGAFSKFLYNDSSILLNNPDLVQQDGVLAFKSAIWFWMMPQCPKPSCHQVMQELWQAESGDYTMAKMYKKGFAHTNNIINGGLECRSTSSAAGTQKVVLRSELYKYYLDILGFTATEIANEDGGDYSTLCYESNAAMQDYVSCIYTLSANNFEIENLKLYPNPFETNLNIQYTQQIEALEIFDVLGQTYYKSNPNLNETILDLNWLNAGVYFIKITSGDSSATYKIIKK